MRVTTWDGTLAKGEIADETGRGLDACACAVALHARRRGDAIEQSALVVGEVASDRRPFPAAGRVAAIAVVLVAAALAISSSATASTDTASLDQRTRTIAFLVKKCGRGATRALSAATSRSDVRRRQELVSLGRAGCDADERRLLKIPSDDLDFVPEDALAALDDWRRGLGLLADYAASGRPSTLAKARQSVASGTAWSIRVLEEIDQTRLRHGFARLP